MSLINYNFVLFWLAYSLKPKDEFKFSYFVKQMWEDF